ncbi:MAG TPA: MOSC domain-containing protein, partial [Acidobacteriota bacterium]|nr:MOSC domain-containing protein [Acidobacteriota bacterium]
MRHSPESIKGTVIQVNIKACENGARGIPKHPVARAEVRRTGLTGDFNRYRQEKLDGDPDSAVLLLPIEVVEELRAEGWDIKAGDLGENVTMRGISHEELRPGNRLFVGERVELEISRECKPCQNLRVLPSVGS